MSNKNDIQAFDQIFKNQLEEATVNPPAGLWESIASQTAPINAATTASKWGATWLKTLLISGTIGISSLVIYQYNQPKQKIKQDNPIETEKIVVQSTIPNEVQIPESIEVKKSNELPSKIQALKNTNLNPIDSKIETTGEDGKTNESAAKSVTNSGILNIPKNIIPSIISIPQKSESGTKEHDENSEFENSDEIVTTSDEDNKTTIVNSEINIPNVVTPNGDGLNDTYFIEIQGEEYFEMVIYNSKMEKLFETKSKYKAWDCKLPNGELAPSGNYTVFLKYKFHNQEFESQYIKLKVIK